MKKIWIGYGRIRTAGLWRGFWIRLLIGIKGLTENKVIKTGFLMRCDEEVKTDLKHHLADNISQLDIYHT